MVKIKKSGKGWLLNRYFLLTVLFNLAVSMMVQLFNSTISLHINSLGKPAALAGTITSVGAVIALFYRVFGGTLCNRCGRRKLIAIGMPIFAIASFLMSLTNSILLLFLFRMFQMLGYAALSTSISIAVVDIIPKEHMSEGIGYYGLAASLAQAVGPALGVALFHTAWAFRTVMMAVCGIGVITTIIVIGSFDYEKEKLFSNRCDAGLIGDGTISKYRGVWTFLEESAIPAATVNFFLTFGGGVTMIYLTLYAERTGIANAGLFFTFSAIMMVIARLSTGTLSDRFGTLSTVLPGCLLYIASFLMLIMSGHIHFFYYIAGALNGFGGGMTSPALNAAAVKAAPPDRKALASSTFMIPTDVSFMCSSIIWGFFIDYLSFSAVFACAGGIAVVALLFGILFFGKKLNLKTRKEVKNGTLY